MSAQMKDRLWKTLDRMIVDAWKLGGCKKSLDMLAMRQRYDDAIIDAESDGGAVGEYVANVDKYGGILWLNGPPAHGTKIYTHPARSAVVGKKAGDGWKLAMWVIQSDMYRKLPEEERAVCDALISENPFISAREAKP